eukprot:TRINITY_DN19461_c0_g2_i3.p1 TRINITY_DN19461_c0_g2~~TRINITY_DN19461_c0_g2_i3.p1  ORF type:complete len:262 (-),score=37.04 TRINITY_DN19461_c0_g2_i3:11-796(-)
MSHPEKESSKGKETEKKDEKDKDRDKSPWKRQFNVFTSKSLGRQKNYLLVLDFEKHNLYLVKQRGSKETRKTFNFVDCVKLEKERKDPRKLSLTFSRQSKENSTAPSSPPQPTTEKDLYKKLVAFATKEDRELFCDLIHAVIVTGPKAYQTFRKMDKGGNGIIKPSDLNEASLTSQLGYSDSCPCPAELDFFKFLLQMGSNKSATQNWKISISKTIPVPAKSTVSSEEKIDTASLSEDYLAEIGRAVQQECRDRSRMPSSA